MSSCTQEAALRMFYVASLLDYVHVTGPVQTSELYEIADILLNKDVFLFC